MGKNLPWKKATPFRAWMILFISFNLFETVFKWSHWVREWNSSITTSLNHHSLKFISGYCFLLYNKKKSAWSLEIYKRSSWSVFLALSPCLRGKIPTKRVYRGSWTHEFHEDRYLDYSWTIEVAVERNCISWKRLLYPYTLQFLWVYEHDALW